MRRYHLSYEWQIISIGNWGEVILAGFELRMVKT
ncbi:hypothetical protein SHDE107825_12560 [Shewanella denitrificans]